MSGNTSINLAARTFEYTLKMQFHMLIGRQLDKLLRSFFLGMRRMYVIFKSLGNFSVLVRTRLKAHVRKGSSTWLRVLISKLGTPSIPVDELVN